MDAIIVHALEIGSPPAWDDVAPEFQADLAAMDRLDNGALSVIARSRMSTAEEKRYDELLNLNQEGGLTDAERLDLDRLRSAADSVTLRKAHATVVAARRSWVTVGWHPSDSDESAPYAVARVSARPSPKGPGWRSCA